MADVVSSINQMNAVKRTFSCGPTTAVAILITGGIITSSFAMMVAQNVTVFLMGGICIMNTVAVGFKHLSISKKDGIRALINLLRLEFESLETGVDDLTQSVDELKVEADKMKGLEENLKEIAKQQEMDVNNIVTLVNENEEIVTEMKTNLKQTFVMDTWSVLMQSDRSGDMKIDAKELPLLSLRLQTQLQSHGIELDTAKFQAMVRENNDVSNIVRFCCDLLFGDEDDDDEDDDEPTAGQPAQGGNHQMSRKEKLGMLKIDEKYSKGSVDAARGEGAGLGKTQKSKDGRNRRKMMMQASSRQTASLDIV